MSPPRPTVLCNPNDDLTFRREVHRVLPQVRTPADLQTALRATYPSAVVRARDLSAESHAVWYAYRDGRWTPAGGGTA
jgi:hypothetical protein